MRKPAACTVHTI